MGHPGPQFTDSCSGKYLMGRRQAKGYVNLELTVDNHQILLILPEKSSLISCFSFLP